MRSPLDANEQSLVDKAIGNSFGAMEMGSMALNDRFTLVANVVALAAVLVLAIAVLSRRRAI